ncbi:hypothetical protein BIV57_08160 [Mangrovactinospora gilvigrisea]|uniref:Protein kinase domain-containing protein n=1 Tax=Mangrovactinospora gilvigrisea TaxID=1428644 RepID=A0A1J7BH11_9ACTN|nr:hypothetical protein BIV57_08160 [Mangrovactinospora gilvigrisea]
MVGEFRPLWGLEAPGGEERWLARGADGSTVTVTSWAAQRVDARFREALRRGADAARTLPSGGRAAPVVDADADDPQPWVAHEFALGLPLPAALARIGPFPEDLLRTLGTGLARAFLDLQRAGLGHPGVVPADVQLDVSGPRLTACGIPRGPAGAPPPPDAPAAVHAVGALVRHACGGGAAPPALEPVLRACLDPDPRARPRLADLARGDAAPGPLPGALTAALAAQADAVLRADAPTLVAPHGPRPARRALLAAGAALLAAGGAATVLAATRGGGRPHPKTTATADTSPTAGASASTLPTMAAPAGVTLPTGYVLARDPAGFQIAVPAGYSRSELRNGSLKMIDYVATGSGTDDVISVGWETFDASKSPGDVLSRARVSEQLAQKKKGDHYRRVSLTTVRCRGGTGAVLTYLHGPDGASSYTTLFLYPILASGGQWLMQRDVPAAQRADGDAYLALVERTFLVTAQT